MTELNSKAELALYPPGEYLLRVDAFLTEAGAWCRRRGLAVEGGAVTLREERLPEYEAPSLGISTNGIALARLLPAGSKFVGAQGGLDLVGRMARHTLLFCIGKGAVSSRQTIDAGKASGFSSVPMLSRVDQDGWYWIDSHVWQARRVDESLFLNLLTDVSDHEF